MPIIQVHLLEGRPPDKIEALIRNLTAVAADTLEVPQERVRLLVNELPLTHWGIGGVPAGALRRQAPAAGRETESERPGTADGG